MSNKGSVLNKLDGFLESPGFKETDGKIAKAVCLDSERKREHSSKGKSQTTGSTYTTLSPSPSIFFFCCLFLSFEYYCMLIICYHMVMHSYFKKTIFFHLKRKSSRVWKFLYTEYRDIM